MPLSYNFLITNSQNLPENVALQLYPNDTKDPGNKLKQLKVIVTQESFFFLLHCHLARRIFHTERTSQNFRKENEILLV